MINKVLRCTALTFVVLVFAAYSQASPMAGNQISLDYGSNHFGSGGEFLLESTTPGNDYAFITFCLEKNEYFNPGNSYIIESVDNYANNGGIARDVNSPAGKDYISNTTKWLMNEYIFNYETLSSGWGGSDKNLFAGLMQNTVWFLENEISSLDDSYLLTYATQQMGDDYSLFYTTGYLSNIKVANIVDANGNKKQSQLIANPVPEPATMLLFGTGLIGLAAIGRKRNRR